jgi:hypothetical protein
MTAVIAIGESGANEVERLLQQARRFLKAIVLTTSEGTSISRFPSTVRQLA